MARRKRKPKDDDDGLDDWINKEASLQKGGCPLCLSEVKEELERMEKRLRHKGKRVSMRAIWRRLTELKLTTVGQSALGRNLQRTCHLKFYKYLKGLE